LQWLYRRASKSQGKFQGILDVRSASEVNNSVLDEDKIDTKGEREGDLMLFR
jgi:hypothetical protein